jgi:hypothetical protein
MIQIAPEILRHVLTNLPILLIRDALLDLFTETEQSTAVLIGDGLATPNAACYIYTGKLLNIDGHLYAVTQADGIRRFKDDAVPVVSLGVPVTGQLCARNSPITLRPGDLANIPGEAEIQTTMGRLLLNYAILVDPFGDLIPYINTMWEIGRVENTYIFEYLRSGRITVEQAKHYSRNLHFIGHFTEFAVPSLTERSLTVDPAIIARRDELLTEHRDAIAAGDSVVMSKIESELIAMDRASLKGDVSTLFYDKDDKSYEVHRKMMLLTGGMVPEFGGKGYNFIGRSLEEGWSVKDLPVISNEVRRGAYSSAKKTAEGGTETKFLIRIFQNTQIIEADCGSTDYLTVLLSDTMASQFIYRNIVDEDGTLVTLSADNLRQYRGKHVNMRSPMHCKTKGGYCFTCAGELFRAIDQESITMVGVAVTSSFTKAALKAKHFSVARRVTVTSLDKFVV